MEHINDIIYIYIILYPKWSYYLIIHIFLFHPFFYDPYPTVFVQSQSQATTYLQMGTPTAVCFHGIRKVPWVFWPWISHGF